MTSEFPESEGPNNEQLLLYIDPFFLDRRNHDPDRHPNTSLALVQDLPVEPPDPEPHASQIPSSARNHNPLVQHNAFESYLSHPENAASSGPASPPSLHWSCESCPRTFETAAALRYQRMVGLQLRGVKANDFRNHRKSHRRNFPCAAQNCGLVFSYRKDLTRHFTTQHTNSEGWLCQDESCPRSHGKPFKRLDNFRRHMATQHPEL